MRTLFERVAEQHGVSARQVADSLGRNRSYIEAAEILPFALLYALVAGVIARTIWRRHLPSEHGWSSGLVMSIFLSLVFAAGATIIGETWCGLAETFRIGNGHMSYRLQRLFWARHRTDMFAFALVIFVLASGWMARHMADSSELN